MKIFVENTFLTLKPNEFMLFIWKVKGVHRRRSLMMLKAKTIRGARAELKRFMKKKNVTLIKNTNPQNPRFIRMSK